MLRIKYHLYIILLCMSCTFMCMEKPDQEKMLEETFHLTYKFILCRAHTMDPLDEPTIHIIESMTASPTTDILNLIMQYKFNNAASRIIHEHPELVHQHDFKGKTSLSKAVAWEEAILVEELLTAGANPNTLDMPNKKGYATCAWEFALACSNRTLARIFIEKFLIHHPNTPARELAQAYYPDVYPLILHRDIITRYAIEKKYAFIRGMYAKDANKAVYKKLPDNCIQLITEYMPTSAALWQEFIAKPKRSCKKLLAKYKQRIAMIECKKS